ncbi:MAG: hypothetical protein IT203_10965, partial [Fimbriimonadaceae bacterium]|nr:hypothetical protein [Fimbriimonadaceae bacterium]
AGVVQSAYALNAPVRHAHLSPKRGENGALPELVGCDDRNIVIEAVKKAEDDASLIVRLYECHNSSGSAELYFDVPIKSAIACDLEEKELHPMEVVDGAVPFDYKPFEIKTIKLVV